MIHWKKSVLIFSLTLLVIAIAGCSHSEASNEPNEPEVASEEITLTENVDPVLELSLDITYFRISEIPNSVQLTITNTDPETEYRGSYHCSIDRFDGEHWSIVVSSVSMDEEFVLLPGEETTFAAVQLMPDEYEYTVGEYRVTFDNRCCVSFYITE